MGEKNRKVLHKDADIGFVPPQNTEAEAMLLGAMLLERDCCDRFVGRLRPEYFYLDRHQKIYLAIEELHEKGIGIDIITITERLRKVLDDIGGAYYVTQLVSRVASSANSEHHFLIIYQKYLQRELGRLCYELGGDALRDEKDIFDIKELLIRKTEKLFEDINGEGIVKPVSLYERVKERKDSALISVYKTGHKKFDQYITLTGNKIIMISGAVGHGKSKFVRSLLFGLLKRYGSEIAVDWVTLEDEAGDIMKAYAGMHLHIKVKDIKRNTYNTSLNEALFSLYEEFGKFDIEFTEIRTYIGKICKHFKEFCKARKDKMNILVIDNILSMDDINNFRGDPVGFADYVMGELLKCRQETRGLIIPVHHYKDAQQDKSRLIEAYRPVLSDLKGSEAYRRVPNDVLLINNPGKYKDLLAEYPEDMQEIIKHIFIVDPGKNREDENTEDTVLRFIFTLNYEIFEEV